MHKKNSWRMHKYRLRKRNNKNNSSNYLWQATANKKNITLPEPQPLTHRPRPRRRPLLAAAANALQGRWTTTKTTKIQKQSHKSVTKSFVICSEFAQLFWTYLLLHSIFPGDANLWASKWRDNGYDTTIPCLYGARKISDSQVDVAVVVIPTICCCFCCRQCHPT